MTDTIELTYDEAAEVLDVSPRAVRDIFRKYRDTITPRRYGYNRVRFSLSEVIQVKKTRQRDAIKAAKAQTKKGMK